MEKKLPQTLARIRQDWAPGETIKLMFQDEARFGRISDVRRCWAPKPVRPMCQGMLTHEYTYAYGAVDVCTGELDSLILPHVNTECMQLFITEIASRYPDENIVMVVDGAGWHQSKSFAFPENLRLHFLPPYSPELNPQEHIWDELREKYFHNKAFDSLDALEEQLLEGLWHLEHNPQVVNSITAWDWILNSVSNAN